MNQTPGPSLPSRLAYVDGIRGIAISIVMLFHASIWAGLPYEGIMKPYYLFDGWVPIELGFLRHLLSVGIGGVDLFLAVSGFCLFWPLVRDGQTKAPTLEIGPYLKRRARRIFPPYWVALALVFLCSFLAYRYQGTPWFPWNRVNGGSFQNAFPLAPDAPANILAHLTLTHGLFPQFINSYEGAYWSLSIELQFYILFIPLALVARRFGVLWAALVPLFASLAFLLLAPLVFPGFLNTSFGFLFVLTRWAQFGAGMLAAAIVSGALTGKAGTGVPSWAALVAVASLALAVFLEYTRPSWPWLIVSWGNAGLWLLVAGARESGLVRKALEWRPLVWLGTISYSVYLLHDIVYMAMATLLSRTEVSRDVRQALYLFAGPALAVAISAVFFFLVERRFLNSARTPQDVQAVDESGAAIRDHAAP